MLFALKIADCLKLNLAAAQMAEYAVVQVKNTYLMEYLKIRADLAIISSILLFVQ